MSDLPAFPRNTWLLLGLAVLCFTGCGAVGHGHSKAHLTASLSNLRRIGIGIQMYAQDYEEHFPPMEDSVQLEKLLRPYSKDVPWKFPPYNNVRYASNPSLSRKLQEKLENPAEVVMLYEPVVRRGFRLVAYADGHVKMIREEHWAELSQKSGIPLRTEPTIAPWWRWDTNGPREPLNQEVILLTFV